MATEVPHSRSHSGGNGHNGNGSNGNGLYGSGLNLNEQIREILHVVFKRWRWAALLFILVALPGLILTALRKPSFVATAKVLITSTRADLTIQPTDMTRLTTVNLNESVVNSEVHIIKSRELLEEVAHQLTLGSTRTASRSGVAYAAAGGNGTEKSDRASLGTQVMRLNETLAVTPIKNSNVIQVDYRSSDPKYAAQVVNRVLDEYLSRHAQVHGPKGLSRFYEDQRRMLQQNIQRADHSLQEYSDREGIVDPKVEVESSVKSIAETEGLLRTANATISGVEEKIRAIRQQIAEQPDVLKRFEYVEVNPVVTTLTQQLAERRIDRVGLLRRYTEKDRLVRDNAEEIEALEAQLQDEVRDRPTVQGRQILRANPVKEEREHVLLDLEGSLREQRARRAALEEQFNASSRHLVQLRTKGSEFDRLAEEAKNWRETYELYVKREEEARVSEAMDQEKMVNIDVVQRPALPLQRVDNRQSSALLALLSGLIVSIGGTFGIEYLNRSLKSERDVERYLGLPLLGSVSEIEPS